MTIANMNTQEELKDLEQEVIDAQKTYDDDFTSLIDTIKYLQQDAINLERTKKNLADFKQN